MFFNQHKKIDEEFKQSIQNGRVDLTKTIITNKCEHLDDYQIIAENTSVKPQRG